jgi:hypothetical protein
MCQVLLLFIIYFIERGKKINCSCVYIYIPVYMYTHIYDTISSFHINSRARLYKLYIAESTPACRDK